MQGPLIETVKSDEVREYETFISSEWADVRQTFESINPYMVKVWPAYVDALRIRCGKP